MAARAQKQRHQRKTEKDATDGGAMHAGASVSERAGNVEDTSGFPFPINPQSFASSILT